MTRLRSAAQRAPQTLEAATLLAARFAELDGELATLHEQRRSSHAAIDAAADVVVLPIATEMVDISKRLKPWWAANIDALTGGKRKSHEIGGCVIGYRINPAKVHYSGGNDEAALDALLGAGLRDGLVRTKDSLDKPGILKALEAEAVKVEGDPAGQPLRELGFSAPQKEVFFLDRVGAAAAVIAGDEGED